MKYNIATDNGRTTTVKHVNKSRIPLVLCKQKQQTPPKMYTMYLHLLMV